MPKDGQATIAANPSTCLSMSNLPADVASSMLPQNSLCVSTNMAPPCPSKGDSIVAKNADGYYSLVGHLSIPHVCFPSGVGSAVFTNLASKDGIEFLKTTVQSVSILTSSPVDRPFRKIESTTLHKGSGRVNEDLPDLAESKPSF